MMSDARRVTAESIVDAADYPDPGSPYRNSPGAVRLALAYLAANPADDEEAVTEARLRALPGTTGEAVVIWGRRPRLIYSPPVGAHAATWVYQCACGDSVTLPAPATMGEA